MAFVIKTVLDEAPVKRTRGVGGKNEPDYTDALALINAIPSGKHVEIELPLDEFRAFSAHIRAAGRTVNKTVETFLHRKGVYVSWVDGVTPRAPRGSKKAAAEAAKAATEGEPNTDGSENTTPAPGNGRRQRELTPA